MHTSRKDRSGIFDFTPRHTIIGKGIAHVKPLDPNLPLRPI